MMRRNIVIAVAVVAVSMLALYGQSVLAAKMAMPGKGMYMTDVYDKLGLTPDQKARIDAIRGDAREQMRAVRADGSLTRAQRFARLREIAVNKRARIDEVLTPDQREKLKELFRARMEAREKRFAEYLGLTADQQARVRAIHEEGFEQMRAVRADTSLTPEQKTARLREIRTEMHESIMSVLTPEQRDKLTARKGDGMRYRRGVCPVL